MAGETEWPQIVKIGRILAMVNSGESCRDSTVTLYDPAIDEVVGKTYVSNSYDVIEVLRVLGQVLASKEAPNA